MIYSFTKRVFDIVCAYVLLVLLFVPCCFIAVCIFLTSPGPVFYLTDRVGRMNRLFKMVKFRTMHINTPALATHLLSAPDRYLTQIGGFLRKYSLDEIPQLINILKGDMSFVGPRPALFNQDDLVALRSAKGIQRLVPGLTGWAQVNGRDNLSIPVKAGFDEYYLLHQSFAFDIRILFITVIRVVKKEGVRY